MLSFTETTVNPSLIGSFSETGSRRKQPIQTPQLKKIVMKPNLVFGTYQRPFLKGNYPNVQFL